MKPTLIMIVDDEPDLVEFLKEIIECLVDKICVIVATSSEQAKIMILNHKSDLQLLFLDLCIDDNSTTSGFELYEFTRQLNDELPIVIMSGQVPLPELSSDNYLHFLSKPFDYNDIQILINRILEKGDNDGNTK